ncbi:hypothetical protein [Streptomyces sp. NPDC021020]|uniref:hypothetical protein n=1 Tax=Streptomyces sp. NPDC021020 TaxID=3365109 RepID=UPI0037A31CCE
MNGSTARRSRHVATAVLAAASLVALAGCGGSGDDKAAGKRDKGATAAPTATATATAGGSPLSGAVNALTALDLVRKTTDGAHSARVETTLSVGTTMSMHLKGSLDWADGLQGAMTIDYSGGAVDQAPQGGLPTSIQARYLKDAYYANMGDEMAGYLGGKHWIRYDYDDLASLAGSAGASMKDTIQNGNPVKGLDVVLASPDIKKVGTATVRGVTATHYHGTLDLAGIGKAVALSAQSRKTLLDSFTRTGISSETVDLWVSQDNLPVEAATTANSKSGAVRSTTYYTDYGTPVHVSAPSPFDTVDFSEAMNGLTNS